MRAVLKTKDGMQTIIGLSTLKDPAGGYYVPAKFISKLPGSDEVVVYTLLKVDSVRDIAYFEESDEPVEEWMGSL